MSSSQDSANDGPRQQNDIQKRWTPAEVEFVHHWVTQRTGKKSWAKCAAAVNHEFGNDRTGKIR